MDSTGYHYLIDIITSNTKILSEQKELENSFRKVIEQSQFTEVGFCDKKFSGGGEGITGVFLLSESHLSYHTYPETGYISIDLYTCGKEPKSPDIDNIKEIFGCVKSSKIHRLERGL
ncbi:adenosylmethionine decarboxylase [Photobacterium leiognathi]|uniref:adenosylmethionine decarboxylase n=1 Tax=Photobacterium leiognathi TaxID=553611 RepID=UPI002739482B|nr:adenosylmethionine decarboxylase [Photobacterium leiognathi]